MGAPSTSQPPPSSSRTLGEETLFVDEPKPEPMSGNNMRRNYTASAALSHQGLGDGVAPAAAPAADSPGGIRRNTSEATLCELRRRERAAMSKSDASLQGSRGAVVEAVACCMLEHILGTEAALAAMRVALAKTLKPSNDDAAAGKGFAPIAPGGAHPLGSDGAPGNTTGATGASSSSQLAEDEARLAACGVPAGISTSLQGYVLTIVHHLELPNSCIVAALIYVQRAVSGPRFKLSLTNWQPCLLAAFVIAAKLSFDEPVWNEDFVKALRISNIQVCQISRWEADFLQLLHFNTNVTVAQYAQCCFALQTSHQALHGRPCRFFTYLMALAPAENAVASVE